MNKEIEIPEGYEARIEGNKVILEPKESEDERIRKILIHIVKGACNKYGIKYIGDEITEEKLLAYLERQKEQKPESCDCSRDEESYTNGIHHVLMNPEAYGLIKQKPAEWSEEDKGILLSIKCVIDEVWHSKDTLFGYSKEELEEMWNWLDVAWQRLEYPKESKEWSEEDERIMNNCIGYIKASCLDTNDLCECIDWFKSIRPQPHWKPSEEQMSSLLQASIYYKSGKIKITGKTLESLYNDLKSL